MFLKTIPVGSFQCNCTIIGDEKTGEAVIIDPGDEADRLVKEISSRKFEVKYIIHTHAHVDHIGATKKVKDLTHGQIALHKDDQFLYDHIAMQSQLLGMAVDTEIRPIDHYLTGGDILEWGRGNRCEVMHTPGHTPGSLSFHWKAGDGSELIFSGDTLFMGSIGRTDLWGGDYNQIIDSIRTKLMKLDESLVVVPGHGPNTTIGQEKKTNPFVI